MKYHLLDTLSHSDLDFCFVNDPPSGTEDISYRMAQGYRMGDDHPADASVRMSKRKPGTKLPSFIGNTDRILYVSAAVKELIEDLEDPEIELLPLRVLDHKGKVASDAYWVVNPIGTLDCLDLERSEIEWLDDKVVHLERAVLSAPKLEEAPELFRLKEAPGRYVFSDALKTRIEASGATNFTFVELEVAD